MTGYITKGIGGFYYVKTSEGIVECKPRGIFRKQKITPVAGDVVTLETENGAAVIADIAPRRNIFVRPPMANLDVLFLVASTTQPTPSTLVLDKLSAIAVDKGVQPVIVCTKGDLAEAEFLRSAYERSTLPFIRIDYATGEGLDDIRHWINGRLCAFCGNSGVGKSTLLNALLPDVERQTAAISQKLGRGRHTTREVTIFEAFGGRIADTPGFASLEASRAGFIPKENLEHAFPEFGPYLGACQFTGCSHRSEKGCAVRAALAEGKLSQTRYDIKQAGWAYFAYEFAAIPGTLICGWLSDKVFHGRRALPTILFMAIVAVFIFLYWQFSSNYFIVTMSLIAIGFFIYGPVMLIGVQALDLAPKNAAGTAAGLTGFFGYFLGTAILANIVIGSVADKAGWDWTFILLIGACALSIVFMAFTYKGEKEVLGQR